MSVVTSIAPIISAINFGTSVFDGLFVGRGDAHLGLGYFLFLVSATDGLLMASQWPPDGLPMAS